MARLEQRLGVVVALRQLVVVVREVQLAFAGKLPHITIERAVVHVQHVHEIQALGTRKRLVVADRRQAEQARYAGWLYPQRARRPLRIGGFVHQSQKVVTAAGKPSEVVQQHIVLLQIRRRVQIGVSSQQALMLFDAAAGGAVRLHHHLGGAPLHGIAAPTQAVIPHHLNARLWMDERKAQARAGQGIRTHELRAFQVVGAGDFDRLRIHDAALAGMNRHRKIGVGLEHRAIARSQLVGITRLVRGIDREFGHALADRHCFSGPGRDRAISVAPAVGADRRQPIAGRGCGGRRHIKASFLEASTETCLQIVGRTPLLSLSFHGGTHRLLTRTA